MFVKKTMRLFLLSILLLVVATTSSCKKKELKFTIKGNVSALNIGGNLENVNIKVYTQSFSDASPNLRGQTSTDASGNYVLDIERDKYEKIIIQLTKTNFFTINKTYSIDDFTTANDNKLNYKMSPQSWTKFVLKNNAPLQDDELKIQKIGGKTDCEECCEHGYYFFHGDIDTSFICANDGGTYMKFHYWINESDHVFDSVYNVPFETITYTISY